MRLFKLYRKNIGGVVEGCQFSNGQYLVSWGDRAVILYEHDREFSAFTKEYHIEIEPLPPENRWSGTFYCGFIHPAESLESNEAEFVRFTNDRTVISYLTGGVHVFPSAFDPIGSGTLPHDRGSGHYLDRFFDQIPLYRKLTGRSWFQIQQKGLEKQWVDRDHIAMHPIFAVECR
jgi:hypothetical protein